MSAQAGKALKEWFVDGEPIEVPAGFAGRIARRAFAGDRGGATVVAGPGALASRTAAAGREAPLLSFVLQLTAVAAALLMALSIGIRAIELPSGGELQADDASKEWALQELDRLNLTHEDAVQDAAADERESDE